MEDIDALYILRKADVEAVGTGAGNRLLNGINRGCRDVENRRGRSAEIEGVARLVRSRPIAHIEHIGLS